MAAPDAPARTPSGPPSLAVRRLVIGALIAMVIGGWTGDLFLSVLVDRHPLVFIGLNARNRNLVLVSPNLDTWSYYLVGTARLLLSDPLFFLLGRWYGDGAVRWMERRAPTFGRLMRSAEGWFGKAAYPLIAIAPNNFICLFAGASGMSVLGFFAVNVVGTVGRLYVLRAVGDVFSEPLTGFTGWIADHRLIVFAISSVLLAFTIWSERRAGRSEVEALAHLDDELAGSAGNEPTEDPRP